MMVGYARTSTWDQAAGLAAQQRDLKAAGAERMFSEQASSVAQRTKLNECLAFLRDGDVLTVTKPDRLARSTTELLAIGSPWGISEGFRFSPPPAIAATVW